MDLEQIKAAFAASRRRDFSFHGAMLSVCLPTEQEVRAAYVQDRDIEAMRVTRKILAHMVTGWQGVTFGLVMRTSLSEPDGVEVEAPFSTELAEVWIENDVELHDKLFVLLDDYREKQRALREDEAKKYPLTLVQPQNEVSASG
jgi:hypothetical protein